MDFKEEKVMDMNVKTNKGYTVAIINLGCKVNKYEADSMKNILADSGFVNVEADDVADFYIVNTCSVTNIAEKKSRQMLRRAKKRNPEAVVVAAGCYVNADHNGLSETDFVDIVVGNNHKKDIADILIDYIDNNNNGKKCNADVCAYSDISTERNYEEMGSLNDAYMDHQRAYIKIQDGCNQFCSYCIIPYTRGRVRSRDTKDILNEIAGLADDGVKEFVLTGIHISSYGSDLSSDGKDGSPQINLADLIIQISKLSKVKRIRLGSLEPRIITKEFLDKVSKVPQLCPHFHLSLQSACNATLKRMNRKYTVEEFKDKCSMLRSYYDRPAITTDVIVGFPGETNEEFEITLKNLELFNLYEIHVFKYSPRKGTVAAGFKGQIPEDVKNDRSDILLSLTSEQKKSFEQSLTGLAEEVLIEESLGKAEDKTVFTGYTKRYVKVFVENENDIINHIIPYTF